MDNQYFRLWDIAILAVIMFGPAFISAFTALNTDSSAAVETQFGFRENIYALASQGIQLFAAFIYLHFRGFRPFAFDFTVNAKSIAAAVILFIITGLLMDCFTSLMYGTDWIYDTIRNNVPFISAFQNADLSLVMFSILNGFYEEFFFLIICTSAAPKYRIPVLIFSVVIRIAIHVYQGAFIAITMGAGLGLLYFFLYTKVSANFFIFAASHAIADILGLSFINLL